MDYRDYAKDLLKRKNELIKARDSLSDELNMLEAEKYSAKHFALCDTSVAKGGGSKYEEHLVNVITVMDNAFFRKTVVDRQLKMIANGLSALDEYETDLIETFYIYKIHSPAEMIMKKYFKERSQVFEDKKKALEKFTRSVYGIVQL